MSYTKFCQCEGVFMKATILVMVASALINITCAPGLLAQTDTGEVRKTLNYFVIPAAQTTSDKASDQSSAKQNPTELMIASGDLLGISLFGTDFSCAGDKAGCEARVSSSGDIVLPLIGSVRVAGLTVAQAEQLIAARFSDGGFFNNLLGSHTLLQAISAAGGTTVKAGNDVRLIHPDHPSESQHVDLSSPTSSSVLLTPGDTIIVSKAGIVYVVGDVRQPTGVVMENSGLTVLKAIAMAQGTNRTASLNNAKLIRTTASGRREIPVPLSKILSNKAEDLQLQAEDILFVPSSAAKSATRRGLEAILQTATGVAVYGRY